MFYLSLENDCIFLYEGQWRSKHDEILRRFCVPLTRARVGGLSHLRHGGGPKWPPPPLTRKLEKLEGRAIRRSTALSEPVRSYFDHFFLSGAYWGQQRSSKVKFSKNDGFIRNAGHYLWSIIATPNPKKQKIALEILFRYGAVRFHLRSTV